MSPFVLPTDFDQAASKEDIYYCFRLILGRNPNPEEWPGHSAFAGQNLQDVVASYVTSAEFANRGMLDKSYLARVEALDLPRFKIFVALDDLGVSRTIKEGGIFEPYVTTVLERYVRPGVTAVDIGANIGYLTMYLASLVGTHGRVIAVEPNEENVALIEASRQLNKFEHVVVLQCAAGKNTGLLVLNLSHCNGTTSPLPVEPAAILGSKTVPCFSLDTILANEERIDLVKIDVEGAEIEALTGMRNLLNRDHPVIVSEFAPGSLRGDTENPAFEYLGILHSLGYQVSVIERDGSETDCGTDPYKVSNRLAGKRHRPY